MLLLPRGFKLTSGRVNNNDLAGLRGAQHLLVCYNIKKSVMKFVAN
jgi:hypothetical protein